MKKAVKTLAFTATALLLLTSLATLVALALYFVLNVKEQITVIGVLYSLHKSQFFNVCVLSAIGAMLCLTLCNHKIGWWNELISIAAILFVALILPFFIDILIYLFDPSLSLGNGYYVFSNTFYAISALTDIAYPLLLVACGMSIAYKHTRRKNLTKE